MMEVDSLGLDDVDRKILTTIIENFGGGPVGIGTIAAAIDEEKDTIESIYEPFLMRIGFFRPHDPRPEADGQGLRTSRATPIPIGPIRRAQKKLFKD